MQNTSREAKQIDVGMVLSVFGLVLALIIAPHGVDRVLLIFSAMTFIVWLLFAFREDRALKTLSQDFVEFYHRGKAFTSQIVLLWLIVTTLLSVAPMTEPSVYLAVVRGAATNSVTNTDYIDLGLARRKMSPDSKALHVVGRIGERTWLIDDIRMTRHLIESLVSSVKWSLISMGILLILMMLFMKTLVVLAAALRAGKKDEENE